MTCPSTTTHEGILAQCQRSPHPPEEWHSAREVDEHGVIHFITWRDAPLVYLQWMDRLNGV